jgi:hypothetical protein
VNCSEPCLLSLLCLQERLDEDNREVCEAGICPMCGRFWVSFYGALPKYEYYVIECPERRITAAQIWNWFDRFKRTPDGDLRNAIAIDVSTAIPDTMYSRDRMGKNKGYLHVAPCNDHHNLRMNPAKDVARAYIKEKYGGKAA